MIPLNVGSSASWFPDKLINPFQIASFVKKQEGGLSNSIYDSARRTTKHKYHTNKGVTYPVFLSAGYKDYTLFLEMPDSIWDSIWLYNWEISGASKIKNQNLANLMAWWTWGAGMRTVAKDTQYLLNKYYDCGLEADGVLGEATINALNMVEPCEFIDLVLKYRKWKLRKNCVNSIFFKGWIRGIEKYSMIR